MHRRRLGEQFVRTIRRNDAARRAKISRANVEPVLGCGARKRCAAPCCAPRCASRAPCPSGRGGVQPSGGGSVAAIGSRRRASFTPPRCALSLHTLAAARKSDEGRVGTTTTTTTTGRMRSLHCQRHRTRSGGRRRAATARRRRRRTPPRERLRRTRAPLAAHDRSRPGTLEAKIQAREVLTTRCGGHQFWAGRRWASRRARPERRHARGLGILPRRPRTTPTRPAA